MELLQVGVDTEGVAFMPGDAFAASHALRLSFGNNPPSRIEEAIARLARTLKAFMRSG